ncbi:hypothetical protein SLA2020_420680 [Shorea laevis]
MNHLVSSLPDGIHGKSRRELKLPNLMLGDRKPSLRVDDDQDPICYGLICKTQGIQGPQRRSPEESSQLTAKENVVDRFRGSNYRSGRTKTPERRAATNLPMLPRTGKMFQAIFQRRCLRRACIFKPHSFCHASTGKGEILSTGKKKLHELTSQKIS